MLTQKHLKSLFNYDPDTGVFVWKNFRRGVKVGMVAGYKDPLGYIFIRANQKLYPAHRLAWLYMTGSFPAKGLDHINRIPSDNRFSNLREATKQENGFNRPADKDNKLGIKGVSKNRNKFSARAKLSGKCICLGTYDTPEEAGEVYQRFAKANHGKFFYERRMA